VASAPTDVEVLVSDLQRPAVPAFFWAEAGDTMRHFASNCMA